MSGYYRVNYDAKNWELLIKELTTNHESIHVANRAQLLDDGFNLARSGMLGYETALGITKYLTKETNFVPWRSARSGFGYINAMLSRTPAYGEYKV